MGCGMHWTSDQEYRVNKSQCLYYFREYLYVPVLEFDVQLFDVTVIVTMAEVAKGVPVIMKSFDAVVVVTVSV